jgi:ubiquinone/menaquinone biosynthesis C-methylase UbiE
VTRPDRSGGAEFLDDDVVAAYVHRPDYPSALYDSLLNLMPRRRRVLDLGTGPGKIARAIAGSVEEVLAVDPSTAMLDLGRSLDDGAHPNIIWTHGAAEDLWLGDASVDLAVAGAAIHWIDCSQLCPNLARALSAGASIAIVEGDGPTEAPWLEAYMRVIRGWVERLGGAWNGQAHRALTSAHLAWIDFDGRAAFAAEVRQSLDDFIACEHSRATWSRTRMGSLAWAFDEDLHAALGPWAVDGLLAFSVETRLAWGRPLSQPGGT